MKVIVTGGAGFIGSHIVDLLIEQEHKVMVVDNLTSGRGENINPGAEFAQVDITDETALANVFRTWKPTHVCHEAAQPSLLRSETDPIFDATVNILGTIRMAQLCKQHHARMVFASTSAVYVSTPASMTETTPLAPTRPYGVSKMSAERYIRALLDDWCILRYGNVYGPRQIPLGENQLIARALDGIVRGNPFSIYGDGKHSRDYIFVEDVAWANYKALKSNVCNIFNASTGVSTSVNDVVNQLCLIANVATHFEHTAEITGEPSKVCQDNTLAGYILGWVPVVPLDEGLKRTVGWYQMHYGATKNV